MSRKALRLYEAAGILPPPLRTPAGYRVYRDETLGVLQFVTQARRQRCAPTSSAPTPRRQGGDAHGTPDSLALPGLRGLPPG